jgi:hypothetical protein
MAAVMGWEVTSRGGPFGLARRAWRLKGALLAALIWPLLAAGPAIARVEPPVTEGVPGESSQVGLWLWILLALAVVGMIGAVAWTKTLRRRDGRLDVYALVGRAIEAEASA